MVRGWRKLKLIKKRWNGEKEMKKGEIVPYVLKVGTFGECISQMVLMDVPQPGTKRIKVAIVGEVPFFR